MNPTWTKRSRILGRKRAIRKEPDKSWWTPREIEEGSTLAGRIGTLELEVYHAPDEWCVSHAWFDEAEATPEAPLEIRRGGLQSEEFERYLCEGKGTRLRFSPVLADRPVVIRPRQPVFLPSGHEATMYISTPVGLRLEVGDPSVLLREMSTIRLSDTWFGPSTREGEICYSDRTHARHCLDDVPRRAYRAITPLAIRNDAASPLPLEKISLPVPLLSLYGAEDGGLWTQAVSLVRGSNSDMANLTIAREAPHYGGAAEMICGPRLEHSRSGLVRAFSLLFGN